MSTDAKREGATDREVILAFGLSVEGLPSEGLAVEERVEVPKVSATDQLSEQIDRLTAEHSHLIVVYPSWLGAEGLLRVRAACRLATDGKIAVHETPLPPLAAALLVSLTRGVAPSMLSAGTVVAAMPALEDELHVFAWLGSVARLAAPRAGLADRMISRLPWTSFGVSSYPEPSITRLTRNQRSIPIPDLNGDRKIGLAISGGSGEEDWIETQVARGLGKPEQQRVGPTSQGAFWWGTDSLVESVAYPSNFEDLAERVSAELVVERCRWCGEVIASDPCPFCAWDASIELEAG